MHAFAPVQVVHPVGQFVHTAAPAAEYVPAEQVLQDAFPVPEAYVPAGQAVQEVTEPPAEYCPAGQLEHADPLK